MNDGFHYPFPASTRTVERGKVVTAREAVQLVRSGDTIATGGFVGLLNRTVMASSGAQAGLKILPVEITPHHIAVDIVTIKHRTLSPLTKLFIDCAREVAKPFKAAS